MIISSSNVLQSSQRTYQRNVKGQTSVTRWQDGNPKNFHTTTRGFSLTYSEEALYNNYNDFAQSLKKSSSSDSISGVTHPSEIQSALDEISEKTLRSLFDLLYRCRRESAYGSKHNSRLHPADGRSGFSYGVTNTQGTLWNQVTDTYYSYEESESTTFASTGTAITVDGREIEFDVSFTMSRAFKEEYRSLDFCQYEQVLTDPLVIHLDSNPDIISEQTFFFDIDCDGKEDEISSLANGKGFLALDKNNDGIINDGSELFGTRSGNGFYDLAQYDLDGNGWIDEADEIFSQLKVWTKDEDGNDKLLSLKDANVGAIYLGSSNTQFSLKDAQNSLNAMVRSSGIFLKETGESGMISQVDFAKH